MIGSKPQDPTDKIQFSATAHTDLSVHVGGKPAKLAVITEDGTVVASGAKVAKSAAWVTLNTYRNFLQGKGFIKVVTEGLKK